MTALCGGGTSAPNVLPELAATYSAGRLAQLLVAAGLSELSAWIPLVGLIPVVYSAFCSTDPPTMVALTQAESDAIANNTFGTDFINGIGKFKDVLLNLVWLDACHCTSGTLTRPAVPAVNANTPVFVSPSQPVTVPCETYDWVPTTQGGGTTSNRRTTATLYNNKTSLRLTTTSTITIGAGKSCTYQLWCFDAQGTHLTPDQLFVVPASGVSVVQKGLLPNTVITEYVPVSNALDVANQSTVVALVELFCNGDIAGGTQTPCCPPDVTTQAYLDLILKQVNLIQRQSVPFGYIASTVHSGLTGAGSAAIAGLLGVKVEMTTIPTPLGREGTSPEELFGAGFVTFGTADGYPSSYRVEHSPQLLLPPRCSAYTNIAWDLHPGVVATITELVREP